MSGRSRDSSIRNAPNAARYLNMPAKLPDEQVNAPQASTSAALPSTNSAVFVPFRFLDLPRELRDIVYKFCLEEGKIHCSPYMAKLLPSITQVNKQTRAETQESYSKCSRFKIEIPIVRPKRFTFERKTGKLSWQSKALIAILATGSLANKAEYVFHSTKRRDNVSRPCLQDGRPVEPEYAGDVHEIRLRKTIFSDSDDSKDVDGLPPVREARFRRAR